MSEPLSLSAFKEAAQKFHCAYHLASIGLVGLRSTELDPTQRDAHTSYTLRESESGEIISALPTKFLLQGVKKDGPISQTIALSVLSWVYASWDHKYRKQIAQELNVDLNRVKSDVMGDLRKIRHYAAHDLDRPIFDPSKLKELNWFQPGLLIVTSADMDKIQLKVNSMQVYLA